MPYVAFGPLLETVARLPSNLRQATALDRFMRETFHNLVLDVFVQISWPCGVSPLGSARLLLPRTSWFLTPPLSSIVVRVSLSGFCRSFTCVILDRPVRKAFGRGGGLGCPGEKPDGHQRRWVSARRLLQSQLGGCAFPEVRGPWVTRRARVRPGGR